MPLYHALGSIPRKRHTQFRKADGSLYYEELIGNLGFSGLSSLLYHAGRPTQARSARLLRRLDFPAAGDATLRPRHFRTDALPRGGKVLASERVLLANAEVSLAALFPSEADASFLRNGQADQIVFVRAGSGALESAFGELPFGPGDYVVVPRGIIHRWRLEGGAQSWLSIESRGYVRTPRRYRNPHGQLLEQAPFCERDIRRPAFVPPREETGEFEVMVQQADALYSYVYGGHPFDVIGWDGYYYPWAFNIGDFEPITGRIHQPPPVHQTFEGDGFVVCSFVPRLYDYHPDAIPAPYHHSNVGSDEVLYYVSGEFMSRKGIEEGSITYHPDGVAHGPHPGTVEASIGAAETRELAVMIDTFRPLNVTRAAEAIEDPDYLTSWLG
jgi:homogentisate 1,2-dioxygenase